MSLSSHGFQAPLHPFHFHSHSFSNACRRKIIRVSKSSAWVGDMHGTLCVVHSFWTWVSSDADNAWNKTRNSVHANDCRAAGNAILHEGEGSSTKTRFNLGPREEENVGKAIGKIPWTTGWVKVSVSTLIAYIFGICWWYEISFEPPNHLQRGIFLTYKTSWSLHYFMSYVQKCFWQGSPRNGFWGPTQNIFFAMLWARENLRSHLLYKCPLFLW